MGTPCALKTTEGKGFNADFQSEELEERLIPAPLDPLQTPLREPIVTFN